MELRNFIEDLLWSKDEIDDSVKCTDFNRIARKRRYVKGFKESQGKPMIDRMLSQNDDDLLVMHNSIVQEEPHTMDSDEDDEELKYYKKEHERLSEELTSLKLEVQMFRTES